MTPYEMLAQVDLFKTLPSDVIYEMVERSSTHRTAPGAVLVEQGSPDSGLRLIIEGTATVSVNGVERGEMKTGDYFGEISLIDSQPRSATVIAGPEGVRTLAMSPLTFSQLLDAHPQIARKLLPVLTARIRRIEAAQHD
ncbi:MAG TPA: cyclic nucleotide-binding domain-containing protein [Actinomycetes bacterium]|nr:cyclic nucleotide-binding domain-containing protein [Actinomycetes bacterium]